MRQPHDRFGTGREIEPALVGPGGGETTAGDRDDLAVRVIAGGIGHDGTGCCGIAGDVTVEIRQRPAEATATRAHRETCPGRIDDRARGGAGAGADPDDGTARTGVRVGLGDPARDSGPVATQGVEGQGGRGTRTGLWGDPGQAVGEIIGIGRRPDGGGRGAGGTGALGTRVAGAIERGDGVRVGGATGEPGIGEGVRADGRGQRSIAIDAIALHPDVVGRGGPGEVELLARRDADGEPGRVFMMASAI